VPVLSSALQYGLTVALVTNGEELQKIFNVPTSLWGNIAWIGVDVDAGTEDLYNEIRRPKSKKAFSRVARNISACVGAGLPVDFKILLMNLKSSVEAVRNSFILSKKIGVRSMHIRVAVSNDFHPNLPENTADVIFALGKEFELSVWLSLERDARRFKKRGYNKCYALYLLPVFSADGSVYLCCEYRGDNRLRLCSWIKGEFADFWSSDEHRMIYTSMDVAHCAPCRQHSHNTAMQNCLDDKRFQENLFF
jgi:hypothetical protein